MYYLMILVCILVAVSFYTLFERKVMGSSHLRKGPELIGSWGMLQPFADAVKLFTKELVPPHKSNFVLYYLSPVLIMASSLLLWVVIPYASLVFNMKYVLLMLFVITSGSVYAHLGSGWSSNSNYALIGGLRSIAQALSYEVGLAFLLVGIVMLSSSIDLNTVVSIQSQSVSLFILLPVALCWLISSLAESNRSPFDFAEGESELVSGFNVEYGGGCFALMFIGEYCSMIFMSCLVAFMFGGVTPLGPSHYMVISLAMFAYVWARVSLPRTRYDKLMSLSWLVVLPVSLGYVIYLMALMSQNSLFSTFLLHSNSYLSPAKNSVLNTLISFPLG